MNYESNSVTNYILYSVAKKRSKVTQNMENVGEKLAKTGPEIFDSASHLARHSSFKHAACLNFYCYDAFTTALWNKFEEKFNKSVSCKVSSRFYILHFWKLLRLLCVKKRDN